MNYHNRFNSILWDSGLGFGINVIPYLFHERDALQLTCKGLHRAVPKHTDLWCADVPFQENKPTERMYNVNEPLPVDLTRFDMYSQSITLDINIKSQSVTLDIKSCQSIFEHRRSFRQFIRVYNCLYEFDNTNKLGLFHNQMHYKTVSTNTLLVLVLLIMAYAYKHIALSTVPRYKMNHMEENIIRLIHILDKDYDLETIQSFEVQEVRFNRYASVLLHVFRNSLSFEEQSLLSRFHWVD
jgi:hypothetical protein